MPARGEMQEDSVPDVSLRASTSHSLASTCCDFGDAMPHSRMLTRTDAAYGTGRTR